MYDDHSRRIAASRDQQGRYERDDRRQVRGQGRYGKDRQRMSGLRHSNQSVRGRTLYLGYRFKRSGLLDVGTTRAGITFLKNGVNK